MQKIGAFLLAWVLAPAVFSGVAKADPQFPPRKAGLWENTMTMSNAMMNGQKMPSAMGPPGGMVSYSCVDPASDLKLMKRGEAGQGGCPPPVFGGGGDRFTMQDTCTMQNGATLNISATMTFLNDQHVVVVSHTSGTQMSGDMNVNSVWTGSCPAGVMPGDYGMMMNGSFQKQGNVLNMP
jgi:hypothetical protein